MIEQMKIGMTMTTIVVPATDELCFAPVAGSLQLKGAKMRIKWPVAERPPSVGSPARNECAGTCVVSPHAASGLYASAADKNGVALESHNSSSAIASYQGISAPLIYHVNGSS